MNKTKTILAVTGGVIGLAVLGMAYMVWSAYAAKTAAIEGDEDEGTEGLEAVMARAESLSRKPVYPCAASVTDITSNRATVIAWKDEAMQLAQRGDREQTATTPAAFKAFILREAERLAALPTNSATHVVKAGFGFGPFQAFIAEGKMPSEAELPKLQRQWADISEMVELFATNNVGEVVGVEVRAEGAKAATSAKGNRPVKKANVKEEEAKGPSACTYVLTVNCRPAGFVKALNLLETCPRFAVVKDFSIRREKDLVAEALGSDKKEAAAAEPSSGRGRRSRGRRSEEKQEAQEEKGGVVTDPGAEAPFAVSLTVTTYDFGSAQGKKED